MAKSKPRIAHVIKKAKDGDTEAINSLFKHYEPKIQQLIDYFVENYNLGILDEDDLRQDCYIGIMKCLNANCSFTTQYYLYMLQTIQRDYYKNHFPMKLPSYLYSKASCKEQLNNIVNNYEFISIEDKNISIDALTNLEYDCVHRVYLQDLAKNCKPLLKQREWDLLNLRFGFDNNKCHTLEEIANEFGVTRERIRQMEKQALNKLRMNRNIKRTYKV
jgi:RNA polymerase sigma factor (sigma-70 family)